MRGRKWMAAVAVCAALLLGTACGGGSFLSSSVAFVELEAGDGAEEAVHALLDELEAEVGPEREGSDLWKLNRLGVDETLTVGGHTARLLAFCAGQRENEGGKAFSPALYRASQLWGFPSGEYRIPTADELAAERESCDISTLVVEGNRVTKKDAGLQLDFGGVAKGYALDLSLQALREHKAVRGIVDLAGNLLVLGRKADGTKFKVGIADPRSSDHGAKYAAVFSAADCFVSTSSDSERFFLGENGKRYCHILDPATGAPAESDLMSVTVVMPLASDGTLAGALADYWSTALFVLGRERALSACAALAEKYAGFGYYLLGQDGRYATNLTLADPLPPSAYDGYRPL